MALLRSPDRRTGRPPHAATSAVVTCVAACASGPFAPACTRPPETFVLVKNDYAPSSTNPLVVYQAYWQAVAFLSPILPGQSSAAQSTLFASTNTAYAVLAPGWDPTSPTSPTSLIVLQSRGGFSVAEGDALSIPVDDATFVGNCAAESFLSQSQADFITQFVFPSVFAGVTYDAATCRTTPARDAGGA